MLFSVIHTLLIIASALVLCCLLIGVYIAKKYPGRACDMAATIGSNGEIEADPLIDDEAISKPLLHRKVEIDGNLCDDYRYLCAPIPRKAYYLIGAWYICLRVSYIALLILSLINFILCFV